MRSVMVWLGVLGLSLGVGAAATAGEAEEGFVAIFDGKSLDKWDGNPDFWSVQDGVIHGETTKEKPTKGNTFCIWKGGVLEDFELRLSFRIKNGSANSGVQYRSQDKGKWVVAGYQAEVCNGPTVGFLYHERGRGSLCQVGQKVVLELNEKGKLVWKVVGELPDAKPAFANYKKGGWNDYRIVARGNVLQHFLNGVQTIECTDNDEKGRALSGILALQIHQGDPMVVEFKDIRLKRLPKAAEKAKE